MLSPLPTPNYQTKFAVVKSLQDLMDRKRSRHGQRTVELKRHLIEQGAEPRGCRCPEQKSPRAQKLAGYSWVLGQTPKLMVETQHFLHTGDGFHSGVKGHTPE